jgi:predicted MFS family arabinose efflux permease
VASATWALVIAVFAVGVDGYIVAGILPAIANDLGEPIAAVGLLASAYALPTALLAPVLGPLSDRRGRRAAMSAGLVVFVTAAGACVVAPTLPLLLLARAVNGIGAAIILPAAYAYAGDIPVAAARDRAMGILASTFPLSTLLGLPIGALVAMLTGWRGAFAFITVVALVALVLVRVRCPPDTRRTGPPVGYLATYATVLRDRGALKLLAVTFAWFLAPIGLFVYMAEYVHVTYGVPAESAALIYVVVGLTGVVAARLSGRFMSVLGPRRAVLLAIGLFGTAVLLLPFTAAGWPLAVGVFALWAFGTWFGVPAMQVIVASRSETARGTLLAFNASATNLAGVAGPAITGALIVSGGFGWAAAWSAAAAAGAFLLAWKVLPRPARTSAGQATAEGALGSTP